MIVDNLVRFAVGCISLTCHIIISIHNLPATNGTLLLFQIYFPLNIFIALVGVVVWNESNEIDITSNAVDTLKDFLNYRRTKLNLEHPNDYAQLLTKIKFDRAIVGMVYRGLICI